MHIESGVYPFLLAFEIMAIEDRNPGDVWKGFCVGGKHRNWWCAISVAGTGTKGGRGASKGVAVGGTAVITTMLAFFLVCNTMVMEPSNSNNTKVPWYGLVIPFEPYDGFYTKVLSCLWNVDLSCGIQIYAHIFDKSKMLDDNCCRNVVKLGLQCSKCLGLALSLFEKFKPQKALIDKMSRKAMPESYKYM